MDADFRARLGRHEPLYGTLVSLAAPEVAELLAACGFDWLFLDMEHGALDIRALQSLLQAAGATPCLIRVPALEEAWVKRCLDLDPAGLIVPQVRSRADAERAVRFSRYPPAGERSVGLSRAHRWGLRFQSYVAGANEAVTLVLQIEHVDAVNDIDAILEVGGVDACFVGPFDLSNSLGITGQVDHPAVQGAIERVRTACQAAGRPLGIFGATPEAVRPYLNRGFSLIAVAMDATLMSQAARAVVAALKG